MGDNNNSKNSIVSDLELNNKNFISKSDDNKKPLNNKNLAQNNSIKDIKKVNSSKKVENVVKHNNNQRPTNLANTDLKKVLEVHGKENLVEKNVKQHLKKELKKDNISVNKDTPEKSPQNQKPQNNNNNVIVNNNNINQNNSVNVTSGEVVAKKKRIRRKWKPGEEGYDAAKDTGMQKKLARQEQQRVAAAEEQAKIWKDGINPGYKGNNYILDYHKRNFKKSNLQNYQNDQKNQNKQQYNNNVNTKPFRKGGFYLPKWRATLIKFNVYHGAKIARHPALVEKFARKKWEALRTHALRYNLLTNRAYFFGKNKFKNEQFFGKKDKRWNWKQKKIVKKLIKKPAEGIKINKKAIWQNPTYFRLKLQNKKNVKNNNFFTNIYLFPIKLSKSTKFATFVKTLTFSQNNKNTIKNKADRLRHNIVVDLLSKDLKLRNKNANDSLVIKFSSKFLNVFKAKGTNKKKIIKDVFLPNSIKKEVYQDILTPIQLRKLIRMENVETKNLNFFARVVNHRTGIKQKGEKRPWYDKRWWRYNKKIYDLNVDVTHLFMLKYRNFIFRRVPNLWADTVALLSLVRKGQIDGGAYHDAMITHYRRLYKKHHYGFEQMQRGLSRFFVGRRISAQVWQDPTPIYHRMLEDHEYSASKIYVVPKSIQQVSKSKALTEKKIRFVKLSSIQNNITKKYINENKLTFRGFLRGYGVEVAGRIGAKPRGKYFFQFGGNVGRQTTRTRAYGFENAADSLKYGSFGIKLFMRPKDLTFRTRKLHAKMSRIIALRDEFIKRNVKKLYRFTFVKELKALNRNAIKDSAIYREILVKDSSKDTFLTNKDRLMSKKVLSKLESVVFLENKRNKYFKGLTKFKNEERKQQLSKKGKINLKNSKKKIKIKEKF